MFNYWKKEMDKCAKSPYYYYTNYLVIDGKRCTTNLSEVEFNAQFGKSSLFIDNTGANIKSITNIKTNKGTIKF